MSYTKVFEPLYEDGWENLPIEETPITAEAFNDYDEAITHIEGYLEDVDPNANLADEYDSTSTYDLGDYVIYEGVLYKCTTAISTEEDWDSTHWTSCLVTDEMATSGGTTVIANPSGTATETLTKLQVENTIYGVNGGGGNANIWTGTQAEYEEQASQIADDTVVLITDDEAEIDAGGVIYSTTERCIGTWTDGKPLYQRTFVGTSASNFQTSSVIANCGEGSVIVGFDGFIDGKRELNSYLNEENKTHTWVGSDLYRIANYAIGSNFVSKQTICTVRYTKTIDNPIPLAVKTTPSYEVYSTDEQIIGQWIDGSTLYKKTLTGDLTPSGASYSEVVGTLSALGATFVTKAEGFLQNTAGDGLYKMAIPSYVNSTNASGVYISGTGDIRLYVTGTYHKYSLTLEYIK